MGAGLDARPTCPPPPRASPKAHRIALAMSSSVTRLVHPHLDRARRHPPRSPAQAIVTSGHRHLHTFRWTTPPLQTTHAKCTVDDTHPTHPTP